jgi:glycosyltransferase involved in cell wall biosynthesis
VTVVSLDMPQPPGELAEALRRYWARRRSQPRRLIDLAAGILRGNHVSLQRAIAAGLADAFAALVRDLSPRAVILGRPYFGPFIAAARASGGSVIIDADESLVRVNRSVVGSRAPLPSRARALIDLLAVGRMERRDFAEADQVWVSSPAEARNLETSVPGLVVEVIPNVASRPVGVAEPGAIRRVAFVGSLRHPPNEEAALELIRTIMPRIRASGGPDELIVIGRDPSATLRAVAGRAGRVTLTGEVPDTDAPLREAGVLVAPIRSGGGTRLKLLDAAAAGVPIVSTAFGVEGLGFRPGEDVIIAETPTEFAHAVSRLRDDPALVERLVANARAHVSAHYSADTLKAAVASALARAIRRP